MVTERPLNLLETSLKHPKKSLHILAPLKHPKKSLLILAPLKHPKDQINWHTGRRLHTWVSNKLCVYLHSLLWESWLSHCIPVFPTHAKSSNSASLERMETCHNLPEWLITKISSLFLLLIVIFLNVFNPSQAIKATKINKWNLSFSCQRCYKRLRYWLLLVS